MAKKYKWNTPNEWLLDIIKETNDIQTVKNYFFSIIERIDSDTIQDVFQDEMDGYNYFDEWIYGEIGINGYIIFRIEEHVARVEDEICSETFPWDERFRNGLIYNEDKGWCFTDGVSIEPDRLDN